MRSKLAIVIVVCVASTLAGAQVPPPAKRARHVAFRRLPALETAHDGIAILRWTVNNPGGLDIHLGVVHYGTDPAHLSQIARSPIRLNRGHADTVFRVRLSPLRPGTTYYYKVTSIDSKGATDGVESSVARFTMPALDARFVASWAGGHDQRGPK